MQYFDDILEIFQKPNERWLFVCSFARSSLTVVSFVLSIVECGWFRFLCSALYCRCCSCCCHWSKSLWGHFELTVYTYAIALICCIVTDSVCVEVFFFFFLFSLLCVVVRFFHFICLSFALETILV